MAGGVGPGVDFVPIAEESVERREKRGLIWASLPLAEGGSGNSEGVADRTDARPSTGGVKPYVELAVLSRTLARGVSGLR